MSRWLIERAEARVTVQAKSNAAKELVEIALNGMRAKPVLKSQGVRLSVAGQEGAWEIQDHETDIRRKLDMPGDLIYHLTDRIVHYVADKVESKHCLHAASVAIGDRALMIPANSGAGKSSLTSWLVANGFQYLSDELILLNDERHIEGVSRPIQIKPNGLNAIQYLLKDPDAILPGKLANALTIENLGGECSALTEHSLGLMIFPQYRKKGDFSFTEIRSAQAGLRLMENHINARNLAGHGFRVMMSMIRATPCYALEYGGFDKLPSDFAEQIRRLLASNTV